MISLIPPAGFSTPLYALEPTLDMVNLGPYGSTVAANLYSGYFGESPVPAANLYSMQHDQALGRDFLTLSNPGIRVGNPMLCTASSASTPGNLPLVPMSVRHAVKVRARLIPPQLGNWPCFGWSLPIEHTLKATLPVFVEVDNWEGGAGVGLGQGVNMWGGGVIHRAGQSPVVIANAYADKLHNPGLWHDYTVIWDPAAVLTLLIDGIIVGGANLAPYLSAAELAQVLSHHAYQICDLDTSAPGTPSQAQIARWECWT